MKGSYFRKHCKLLSRYFKIKLKEVAEYKVNLAIFLVIIAVWFLISFFFWRVLLGPGGTLHGWTIQELFLLPIMGQISWGFFQVLAQGFSKLWEYVVKGNLDQYLARPMNVVVGLIGKYINVWSMTEILSGVVVLFVVLSTMWDKVSVIGLIAALFVTVLSAFTISLLLMTLYVSAFWIGENSFINRLWDLLDQWTFYPLDLFPQGVKLFFIIGFPVFFVAVFPVKLIFMSMPKLQILYYFLGLFGLFVFWLVVFIFIWKKGIKRYESGGG